MDSHRFGFMKYYSSKMAFNLKDDVKEDYGGAVKQPDTEVIIITITYAWQIIKIYLLMNASSVIVLVLEIFF